MIPKSVLTILSSVCTVGLIACGGASSSQQQFTTQTKPLVRPAVSRTLTILHTNDMHASFIPHEAVWMKETPKPLVGGMKELEFRVDSIRKLNSNVLLFDGGDVMTGNPISDMMYKGAEGGALYEMMNMLRYDAAALGNHEFDISQENAARLLKVANFPILSANLVNTKNEFPVNNRDYVILERGGLRIGVFGLMLQGLAGVVNQQNIAGIKVLSPEATAQKIIDKIDAVTDLIIAVTHIGIEDDTVLAASVRGLDIIVGGHSHTRLQKPRVVNGVVIVQAGARCENLGVLDITVEDDKVVQHDGNLIQLWARNDRPRTKLSAFVDSINTEIEKTFDEVLGELRYDWERGRGESNIGNFLADAQRAAAQADVAFMNTNGIRANVGAGPLTRRELFEVLPFRNVLVTFQLSGKQLKDAVLYGLQAGDPLQTSGMKGTWHKNSNGSAEFVTLEVGGKPVDEKNMYVCAASDFMVGQGKKYFGMDVPTPTISRQTLFEAVANEVRTAKVIATRIEGRLTLIK
jgi:2',3'-cyclic-nucleotide 2'-phosphodiesterase (5'-nucleotidase family)